MGNLKRDYVADFWTISDVSIQFGFESEHRAGSHLNREDFKRAYISRYGYSSYSRIELDTLNIYRS